MGLLVKGGRVISDGVDRIADVYAQGETISRIADAIDPADVPEAKVVDADGLLVIPGGIDPHVHIHLPFMGTNAIDDHASASRAALVGGTTSIIEMICPGPDDEPSAAFDEWNALAQTGCCCDWSFHLSVVRFDELARRQVRELVESGLVRSFKVFLAYKGALDIPDEHLLALMEMARELGVIITAHCENAEAIDAKQKQLIAEGRTGPQDHEPSRPRSVEAGGVRHLCEFARRTGAHVYIVHTSCKQAVDEANAARARGVEVFVEAVAPHLVLDCTYVERPDFEGAKWVMSPPLRDAVEPGNLWAAMGRGEIVTVGTDHAPFNFHGQKDMGRSDFTRIPNGIPGIQERLDLVHTFGVCAGHIDLAKMVDVCCTAPARIFGMHPRKGAIVEGADADLVVYDPGFTGVFSVADGLSQVDYSGYEGMERRGRAEVVALRGRVVARAGEYIGLEGGGRVIPRALTH